MEKQQLGMFAKYWQPGQVKTRLARSVGQGTAARLYRAFVMTLLERFSSLAGHRVLAFAPRERRDEFAGWAARWKWELQPQASGDLGARMRSYFEQAFAAGKQKVVLIGSDSPTMPLSNVQDAFAALDDHAVALGPSEDGGYYLVAARDEVPPIFDNVSWSSNQVWSETNDRLTASGLSCHVLPRWYDVDDHASLRTLADELQQQPDPVYEHLRQQVVAAWRE